MRRYAAAVIALFVPLAVLDRRMQRTGGPGIIPFELAGTPERARRILDAWGDDGRAAARASLLLDFPFLVAYTGFNVAAVGTESERLRRAGARRLARAGGPVAVAQVVAGACDAVENTALLGVLTGRDERLPAVAAGFARAKFALLGVGWAYALLALALARR
jgi:hypothetical protein